MNNIVIIARNDWKYRPKGQLGSQRLADQLLTHLIIENKPLDYSQWLDCLGAEQLVDPQEFPIAGQNQLISKKLA